jgi:hypothetical protein
LLWARALSVAEDFAHLYFNSRWSWLFSNYEGLEVARRWLRKEAARNAEMLGIAGTLARLQLTKFLRNF